MKTVIVESIPKATPKEPTAPMYPNIRPKAKPRGFALVITLSLMVLLTVLAVGLLSLSAISLRTTTSTDAQAQAYANARLAVLLALGQLQKHAGDDRRITADASISAQAAQSNLVGAYTSWTNNYVSQPDRPTGSNVYTTQKDSAFRSWLASNPDPEALATRDWANTAPESDWVRLFSEEHNGFDLSAPPVELETGAVAWVVSQENTKAKVNVGGPDDAGDLPTNAVLQAQLRPSLKDADGLKHPDGGWNLRANKVLSMNQIGLDGELSDSPDSLPLVNKSYTVHSQGLLTDAVYGGLKVDLNLGFELEDGPFSQSSWGDGIANPFRGSKSKAGFTVPGSFRSEMPLFRPLSNTDNPLVTAVLNYEGVFQVAERFYGAGVPTFDHLRSYYRVAHHLYGNSNSPTVAERAVDHRAATLTNIGGATAAPSRPPRGLKSQTSIKPVLNRMIYLLSAMLDNSNKAQIVVTPVISLWNPYNAALEIEGAVAYPWIDVPFNFDWRITRGTVTENRGAGMAPLMGKQFLGVGHGRQINPYFLCQISSDGSGGTSNPVRFEPGEVRVFAPATPSFTLFNRGDTLNKKIIQMRPVQNANQFTTKGGLRVPMLTGGFDYTFQSGDKVKIEVRASDNSGRFHYGVTLEDAHRLKNPSNQDNAPGGQATGDVHLLKFRSDSPSFLSPDISFAALKSGTPVPIGVIESFHRTAVENVDGEAVADLVYTTNPRNPSITHMLASGSFLAAPHYQTTLRGCTSFNGAIQTTSDGRNSFWGNSHGSSGQYKLPFFDLPRQPMLSLANFQNADLASSPYAPANQFANSWASAWLGRNRAATRVQLGTQGPAPIYDTCFLTNEALWDGYFFSGAAPRLSPGSRPNIATAWDNPVAQESRSLKATLEGFVEDPLNKPLGNPRMRLYRDGKSDADLVSELTAPAGCVKIAGHLMVDGAFNVNSTDVEAWVALLSGMRGQTFETDGGSGGSGSKAAFPRFRSPTGSENHNWNGFRTLDDNQIRTLASNIVEQVQRRGPFLSLAEFVNRRLEVTDLGRSGAIQSAIDDSNFNSGSNQSTLQLTGYPNEARSHIIRDTGTGIPGYLTQADVLQSLAPVITCRSDTFTIRGYGEVKDGDGKVTARAWCEAVVQRVPDFVDPEDEAYSAIADLALVNQTFGRRFEIVSFRQIPRGEMQIQ